MNTNLLDIYNYLLTKEKYHTLNKASFPKLWLHTNNNFETGTISENPYEFYINNIKHVIDSNENHNLVTSKNIKIYGAHLRSLTSFSHENENLTKNGTILKTILLLPYLKKIGINALYLLPINKPSYHVLKGDLPSPYATKSFYDLDLESFNQENYPLKFKEATQRLFMYHWKIYKPRLKKLNLNPDREMFYFEETMLMLMNWTNLFIEKITQVLKEKNLSIQEAFLQLTPIREQEYSSEKLGVHGFIDAIHHYDDEVHLIDYKTNSDMEVKESIKLQLAIYSLLYEEKHGLMPAKVGVFFLRHKLKLMNVELETLEAAKKDLENIHAHTSKTELLEDYPKKPGKLCKWSSGQCDFFEQCKPFEN